jgi:UDP-glucose 4-epimerase
LGDVGADEAYNLAGDSRITIRELAEMMVDLVAPGAEIEYGYETWDGDITTLAADTTKLSALGFEPTVSLEEGLERLSEWYG